DKGNAKEYRKLASSGHRGMTPCGGHLGARRTGPRCSTNLGPAGRCGSRWTNLTAVRYAPPLPTSMRRRGHASARVSCPAAQNQERTAGKEDEERGARDRPGG